MDFLLLRFHRVVVTDLYVSRSQAVYRSRGLLRKEAIVTCVRRGCLTGNATVATGSLHSITPRSVRGQEESCALAEHCEQSEASLAFAHKLSKNGAKPEGSGRKRWLHVAEPSSEIVHIPSLARLIMQESPGAQEPPIANPQMPCKRAEQTLWFQ